MPLGWETGNLDWDQYNDLKDIHGLILIGQGESLGSSHPDTTTLRHELGHVLLNDGSHRNSESENLMAGVGKRKLAGHI